MLRIIHLNSRFSPTQEGQEYVDSILEDVRWIQSGAKALTAERGGSSKKDDGPWIGQVRKTSDSFSLLYDCATALIKSGDAYVESLSAEEMREYRGTLTRPGRPSPDREGRSVEENLALFDQMRRGEVGEGELVLRAKIDMASPNMNMRDPTLYRVRTAVTHPMTGDKWKVGG